jgi:hypothetical protein
MEKEIAQMNPQDRFQINKDFPEILKNATSIKRIHARDPYKQDFFDRIKALQPSPKVVVEFGAACGVWARRILQTFPSIERFFAIDPWLPPPNKPHKAGHNFHYFYTAWMQSVDPRRYLFTKAFPLVGTSQQWGRVFPFNVDLLYVDGDHSYPAVLEDLRLWYPKLTPSPNPGLCIMDNCGMASVLKAANEYFGDNFLEKKIIQAEKVKDNRIKHVPDRVSITTTTTTTTTKYPYDIVDRRGFILAK